MLKISEKYLVHVENMQPTVAMKISFPLVIFKKFWVTSTVEPTSMASSRKYRVLGLFVGRDISH